MRKPNNNAFTYGISSLGIKSYPDGRAIGLVEVPMSFELEGVSPEIITTRGGFSDFPVAARRGVRSGSAKFQVNESPPWLQQAALGGDLATVVAKTTATASDPVYITGSPTLSGAGHVTFDASNLADVIPGNLFVIGTDTNVYKCEFHSSRGRMVFENLATGSANVLAGTGIQVDIPSGITASHYVMYVITPPQKGGNKMDVQAVNGQAEYGLTAYSVATPGSEDSMQTIRVPRCILSGFPIKMEDNATGSGLEVGVQILTPKDGSAPVTIETVNL